MGMLYELDNIERAALMTQPMTEHDRIRKERAERCDRNDRESLRDAIVGLQSTDHPDLVPLHDELQEQLRQLTTRPDQCPHENMVAYTEDGERFNACRGCNQIFPRFTDAPADVHSTLVDMLRQTRNTLEVLLTCDHCAACEYCNSHKIARLEIRAIDAALALAEGSHES